MPTVYTYRYDKQFEKAIGQFIRVFSGFQVQNGVDRGDSFNTKRVPVIYATIDRVVSDIMGERSHFSGTSVPLMTANMIGYDINPEEFVPKYHQDSFGTEETQTETLTRIMGVPLTVNMNLSILADSRSQLFQIIEQILMIFNPKVSFNVDDSLYNPNHISEITLESIQPETVYPISTETSFASVTMSFSFPFRLEYPKEIGDNLILEIQKNLINGATDETIVEDEIV